MSQALVVPASGPGRSSGPSPIDGHKAAENPLLLVHKFLRGRYLIAILLAVVLGPCGAAAGYFAVQLEYTSNATIRIAPYLPKVLFDSEQSNIMPMFDSFLQTQAALIASRKVIELAMNSADWREAGGVYSPEALEVFTKNLTVTQPKSSQLIVIGFSDKDPKLARAGTTAVLKSYQDAFIDSDKGKELERFDLLEKRLQSLSRDKDEVKKKIDGIVQVSGSDDLSKAYELEQTNLLTLKAELASAQMQLAAAQGEDKDSATPTAIDYSKLTVDEIAVMDGRMQSLVDERKALQRTLSDFEATLVHPESRQEYRRAKEALKTQENDIEAYAEVFRENALRAVAMGSANPQLPFSPMLTQEQLAAKVANLQTLFDEAKAKTQELGQSEYKLRDLRKNLDELEEGIKETKQRIEQLELEKSVSGRITVASEPEIPAGPSNGKRRIQTTVLGGLAGGGLGLGLVLLLGFFNPRIRDITDAQDIQPRLLGALPLLPDSLDNLAEVFSAAQCIHQIRTMLHAHMPPQETITLTITASNSGAGKTSFALSLGLSFASSGTRTLIIDGDVIGTGLTHRTGATGRCKLGHVLRKHGVITAEESSHALNLARQSGRPIGHSLLELGYISEMDLEDGLAIQEDSGLGLADALDGELIDDCLADIGVPNLTILPASRRTLTVTNAMSPASVRALLAKLRSSYDVILIDAGPVPGTTDATIMTTCADGVMLVTSRGDQSADVQRALHHLDELNVPVVGLVFNRAEVQDIERSRYSSSVSSSSQASPSKEPPSEESAVDLSEYLAPVSRFGPLPQSVWLSTMHPKIFIGSRIRTARS